MEELKEDMESDTTTTESDSETKSKQKAKRKEDIGPKFLDMYSSIYAMRQELDRIRKPLGTKENPVRTCKDLYYGHPQFKDGEKNNITYKTL